MHGQFVHLVLQLQPLIEMGVDLPPHAAVLCLDASQTLVLGLQLGYTVLELVAAGQQRHLLVFLMGQLLLQAVHGLRQALSQLGGLNQA